MTLFVPDLQFVVRRAYFGNAGAKHPDSLSYRTTHRKVMFSAEIGNGLVEIDKHVSADVQVHCVAEKEREGEEGDFCKFILLSDDLCIASINLDRPSFDEFVRFVRDTLPEQELRIGVSVENSSQAGAFPTIEMLERYPIVDFTYESGSATI